MDGKHVEMVRVDELLPYRTSDRSVDRKSRHALDRPTDEVLDELRRDLAAGGEVREPIEMHYDIDTGRVLIGDGNTRLAALIEAGRGYAPCYVQSWKLGGFGAKAPSPIPSVHSAAERIAQRGRILPSDLGFGVMASVLSTEETEDDAPGL